MLQNDPRHRRQKYKESIHLALPRFLISCQYGSVHPSAAFVVLVIDALHRSQYYLSNIILETVFYVYIFPSHIFTMSYFTLHFSSCFQGTSPFRRASKCDRCSLSICVSAAGPPTPPRRRPRSSGRRAATCRRWTARASPSAYPARGPAPPPVGPGTLGSAATGKRLLVFNSLSNHLCLLIALSSRVPITRRAKAIWHPFKKFSCPLFMFLCSGIDPSLNIFLF